MNLYKLCFTNGVSKVHFGAYYTSTLELAIKECRKKHKKILDKMNFESTGWKLEQCFDDYLNTTREETKNERS
jgi:hypothetical protein